MKLADQSVFEDDIYGQRLKDAETAIGRQGRDPLWDLFRCRWDNTVEFAKAYQGRCAYKGHPGQDGCV
jgi:hypothetical protein